MLEIQQRRQGLSAEAEEALTAEGGGKGVGLGEHGHFDQDIYGGSDSKFEGYVTSIAATDEQEVSVFYYQVWEVALNQTLD